MTTPRPSPLRLDLARLGVAKHSYTVRHLDLSRALWLSPEGAPRSGDVVLARVEQIGQHKKLENGHGRRATLYPGDELVLAYGARYAPDQFCAGLPSDLGACDLVAAGGIAGRVESSHASMAEATTLLPLGLLTDANRDRLNLDQVRPPAATPTDTLPPVFAVVGASMNSGKTTSAAHLIRGLRAVGLRVGAAKVTGTGSGGDVWLMQDSGAHVVYDFTHAGVPSTYRVGHPQVRRIFLELLARLAAAHCDVIVLEVADGIYHTETAGLLTDPTFPAHVDGVFFAANDALGAASGAAWVTGHKLPFVGLTGVLTASPLAVLEARAATGQDVWDLGRLQDPAAAGQLHRAVLRSRGRSRLSVRSTSGNLA